MILLIRMVSFNHLGARVSSGALKLEMNFRVIDFWSENELGCRGLEVGTNLDVFGRRGPMASSRFWVKTQLGRMGPSSRTIFSGVHFREVFRKP